MKISCVLNFNEIASPAPDIILFPEGVDYDEITQTSRTFPDSIVAGAFIVNRKCRGVIWHRGRNQINYLKVLSDGRLSEGCGNSHQMPVYELGAVTVGMLICMDVQDGMLSTAVMGRVRASRANARLICIPASMSAGSWAGLQGPTLTTSQFDGAHVALCNDTYYSYRIRSFIANPQRKKIAQQENVEPISLEL